MDEVPYTYDGGTWPYYIDIKENEDKKQFVYITENKYYETIGHEIFTQRS